MNTNNSVIEHDPFASNPKEIVATPSAEPIVWSEWAKKMGLRGTPISAKELIGTTFDILRARQFESSYKDKMHAWYCVIRLDNTDELFSVVLGGGAVVEILDAFAQSGMNSPLRVQLAWTDGGKHDGYYYLE